MLYYIYYGYITSVTVYKLYEYWEIAKVVYTTSNYTCTAINNVYQCVKNRSSKHFKMDDITDWEICEK